jgi:hypothetical protein
MKCGKPSCFRILKLRILSDRAAAIRPWKTGINQQIKATSFNPNRKNDLSSHDIIQQKK